MHKIIIVRGGPDGLGKGPSDSISVLIAEELASYHSDKVQVLCIIQKLEETSKLTSVKRIPPPFSSELPYSTIIEQCPSAPYPSSLKVASYLKYFPTYDRVMDRMFKTENIDAATRRKIFWWLINFAEEILNEYKPTNIVFTVVPHFAFDFVFYFVAHEMAIDVRAFEHVISSKYTRLVNVAGRLDINSNNFICIVERDLEPEDRMYIKEYVEKRKNDYVLPDYLQRQYNLSNRFFFNLILLLLRSVKVFGFRVLSFFSPRFFTAYLSKKDSFFLTANFFKNGIQKRKYESVSLKEIPREPYVLFALHDEPEMVLVPLCSPYDDQLAFAIFLSKKLKQNSVRLILREHPLMFNRYRTKLRRDIALYSKLSMEENIEWGTDSIDSRTWVKNSIGVVTGTGNIGLEAAILGLPVLNFGKPWYEDIYSTYGVSKLDEFLGKVRNDKKRVLDEQSISKITEGLLLLTRRSVIAISDSTALDYTKMSISEKKENAKKLCRAILDSFAQTNNSKYSTK